MVYVLETILKLAHPFAPFVTETIWQTLDWQNNSLLVISSWPKAVAADAKKAAEFELVKQVITETRAIKTALGVYRTDMYFKDQPALKANSELICRLAGLTKAAETMEGKGLSLTTPGVSAWLDIIPEIATKHIGRLEQQKAELELRRRALEGRLNNESYLKKAPPALVDQTKSELTGAKTSLKRILSEIKQFSDL